MTVTSIRVKLEKSPKEYSFCINDREVLQQISDFLCVCDIRFLNIKATTSEYKKSQWTLKCSVNYGIDQVCSLSNEVFYEEFDFSFSTTLLAKNEYDAIMTSKVESILDNKSVDINYYENGHFNILDIVLEAIVLEMDLYPISPEHREL